MDSDNSRVTSENLIVGIQAGNEDAWTRMTGLFGPHVYKCIVRLSKRRLQSEDMADISQEVFFAATLKIETYRHSREKHGSFRGWLYGITRHKVLQYLDAHVNSPLLSEYLDEVAEWSPESLIDGFDGDEKICDLKQGNTFQAIERIRTNSEDHTWQAFWRTAINGERCCDVAEDLGMADKAVRQACYRTRKRLKKELKRLDSSEENLPASA